MRIDTPFEALDIHLSQWEWCGTEVHHRASASFMDGYANSTVKRNVERAAWQDGEWLTGTETDLLNKAQTFYITDEIAQVIAEAGASMPPAALHLETIPVQTGIVFLPEPIPYWRPSENLPLGLDVQAIGWRTESIAMDGEGPRLGVTLWVYADTLKAHDQMDQEWNRQRNGAPPPLLLIDFLGWASGVEWGVGEEYDEDMVWNSGLQSPHVGTLRKFMLALWTFMSEQIVPSTRVRPPRPNFRRWDRSGIEVPEDGCVTVVHYRPYVTTRSEIDALDAEEAEAPYWSHRWLVRGHWRRIKTKHGTYRLVWVRGYIKGPEDRPLVIKERLGVINR